MKNSKLQERESDRERERERENVSEKEGWYSEIKRDYKWLKVPEGK